MITSWDYRHFREINVIDGDTIEATIDLGFNITVKETFRLYGINCPEKRGVTKQAGLDAKAWTERAIQNLEHIETVKVTKSGRGKFGRYLARIWCSTADNRLTYCLNDELIRQGLAKKFMVK